MRRGEFLVGAFGDDMLEAEEFLYAYRRSHETRPEDDLRVARHTRPGIVVIATSRPAAALARGVYFGWVHARAFFRERERERSRRAS